MTRDEFKDYACQFFSNKKSESGSDKEYWHDIIMNDEEPFWIPEYRDGWKANHFVVTNCTVEITISNGGWTWCKEHLSKVPMCFMTGQKTDWWGFNTEEDALWFVMKFVK